MKNNELCTLINQRNSSGRLSDDAFEIIYSELKIPIYTIIMRIVHDTSAAEDILQEVFLKLYRTPLSSISNPRAYIFQMAHNMTIDSLRRKKNYENPDNFENDISSGADICNSLEISFALDKLSAIDKQIVGFHLNGGLTFREIAKILNMPLGTVLWRYQKLISQLRSILNGGD